MYLYTRLFFLSNLGLLMRTTTGWNHSSWLILYFSKRLSTWHLRKISQFCLQRFLHIYQLLGSHRRPTQWIHWTKLRYAKYLPHNTVWPENLVGNLIWRNGECTTKLNFANVFAWCHCNHWWVGFGISRSTHEESQIWTGSSHSFTKESLLQLPG